MLKKRLVALALGTTLLSACAGNDPGPLAGTWNTDIGTTIQFRSGETEADGIVTKVTYKISGKDVKVVHKAGLTKGSSALYTIIDADTAKTPYLTIHRVK